MEIVVCRNILRASSTRNNVNSVLFHLFKDGRFCPSNVFYMGSDEGVHPSDIKKKLKKIYSNNSAVHEFFGLQIMFGIVFIMKIIFTFSSIKKKKQQCSVQCINRLNILQRPEK